MILIVGATGLVGSATLGQLTARGVPVRALVRGAEKATTLAGPGVAPVDWSMLDSLQPGDRTAKPT